MGPLLCSLAFMLAAAGPPAPGLVLTDEELSAPLHEVSSTLHLPDGARPDEAIRAIAAAGWPAAGAFPVEPGAQWWAFNVDNRAGRVLTLFFRPDRTDVRRLRTHYRDADGAWRADTWSSAAMGRPGVVPRALMHLEPGQGVALVELLGSQPAPNRITAETPRTAVNSQIVDRVVGGAFVGIMMTMGLYSLAVFLLARSRARLYYAIYCLLTAYIIAFTQGLPWLWMSERLMHGIYGLCAIGVIASAIALAQELLQFKTWAPRLYRAAIIGGVLGAPLSLPIVFIGPTATTFAVSALGVLFGLLPVIIAGISAWRRGVRYARFYALGWLLLFLLAGLGGFARPLELPISWHLPALGFILEAGCVGIALAEVAKAQTDRIAALHAASHRFVPHEFLAILARDDLTEVVKGDSQARRMSIMFSDIRSFTSVVEGNTAEQNFAFINRYLEHMEPPIRSHGGFIDSYEGDAIMALFAGSADDAMRAGIGDLQALAELNRFRATKGREPLRIGIGVNTGHLMLGTIGGNERIKCGVIGDPVNLAARIEGMTKLYGAAMLIGEATRSDLEDPNAYEMRLIDVVVAKGKHEPTAVYEVFDGLPDAERALKIRTRPKFDEARAHFVAGRLKPARAIFDTLAAEDPAAALYVERIDELRESGLPPDWDGVMRLTTK